MDESRDKIIELLERIAAAQDATTDSLERLSDDLKRSFQGVESRLDTISALLTRT